MTIAQSRGVLRVCCWRDAPVHEARMSALTGV